MAIYEMSKDRIFPVPRASFADLGIRERKDIQRLLRECIDVISPDTMILAEEFGDWADSSRRIDLLGLDRSGSLVVIELKRTEDGGHMELQAVRYAAMVSPMTFEQAAEAHRKYLESIGAESNDPGVAMLEFMGKDDPSDFNGTVRIVLAAAEFSKEITSTVLWLNEQGVDIRCVRLRPHRYAERVLLDVQQVIPLPEAAEFQIAIQQKTLERRAAERGPRDLTKYDVTADGQAYSSLPKRRFILQVVKEAIRQGLHPNQISSAVPSSGSWMFLSRPGTLNEQKFNQAASGERLASYFTADDDLFHVDNETYALTNQWGPRTEPSAIAILRLLPDPSRFAYTAIRPD